VSFPASHYQQTGAITITGSQTVAGPVTIADDDDASTVDALYLKSEISEPNAPADGEGGVYTSNLMVLSIGNLMSMAKLI